MEPSQQPINPLQATNPPTSDPSVQADAMVSHQEPLGAPAQGH